MVTVNLKDRIKNDTFSSVLFTYQDNLGTPIDITGAELKVQFRFRNKTGRVVKEVSDGLGITITNATAGEFKIDEFTPVDWQVDCYYYDVQMTLNGEIKTYVGGKVKVIQDVTNG